MRTSRGRQMPRPKGVMLCLLLVAAAGLALACDTDKDVPGGAALPPEFTTPIAAAQEAGLPVYWVGPQFEVEGRTFRIIGAKWEETEGHSSVLVEYSADLEGGGSIGLMLTTYGTQAWEKAKTNETPKAPGVVRQSLTVAGWPAELFSIPVGRWTNQLVIVHAGDSVIVAPGSMAISKGGRQDNPLNDPQQLLAVLENLRRYPD